MFEIRQSNYRTYEDFCFAVSIQNWELGAAFQNARAIPVPAVARVRTPVGVEFDCSIHQLVSILDTKIVDVVVEVEGNRQKVIYEFGQIGSDKFVI